MYSRKRVYAPGPPSYRKKARFTKRRYASRRYGRRSGRAGYTSSARGVATYTGFRKGNNRRQYKKLLWDASTLNTHYRSYLGVDKSGSGSNTITNATVDLVVMVPDSFWITAGGAVDNLTPIANSDLFIRGGMATIKFSNDSTPNIHVTLWKIRTTAKGAPPSAGLTGVGWDPTIVNDFQDDYRVLWKKEFQLATDETYVFTHRIRSQKVDISSWNADYNRDYWVWSYSTLQVGGTPSLAAISSHNISYTIEAA